jgi:hypothetical protein
MRLVQSALTRGRPCPIEHRHLAVLPAPEPRHDRPPLLPTSATTIGFAFLMATLETRGSSRNTGAYPSLPTALDRRFRIRDDRHAVGALSDAQRMGPHVAGARAVGGDAMTDIAATEAPAELEHLPGGRNAPSARSPMRSALEISRISAARSAAVTAKLRRTRARAYVTRTGAKTCFCLWSHLDHLDTYIAAETKLLAYLRRRLQLYQLFPDVDLPADLAHQLKQWTGPPPRRPPTQLRLPL